MKNYYTILNISQDATADEIKAAFRKKAKETHPDQHGGDAKYQSLFNDVVEAYEVLSDPNKKAAYDEQLRYGSTNPYANYSGYGTSGNYGSSGYYGSTQNGYGSQGTYGGQSGYSGYGFSDSSGYSYGYGTGSNSGSSNTYGGYSYQGYTYANEDPFASHTTDSYTFNSSQSKEEIYSQVKSILSQVKEAARQEKAAAIKTVIKGALAVIVGILLARYTSFIFWGAMLYGGLAVIRGISYCHRVNQAVNDYEEEMWRKVEEILKERKE